MYNCLSHFLEILSGMPQHYFLQYMWNSGFFYVYSLTLCDYMTYLGIFPMKNMKLKEVSFLKWVFDGPLWGCRPKANCRVCGNFCFLGQWNLPLWSQWVNEGRLDGSMIHTLGNSRWDTLELPSLTRLKTGHGQCPWSVLESSLSLVGFHFYC